MRGRRRLHPCGFAAQVYNLRSSIKVAEDFVSPEHVERCLELTRQFRALPPTHRRKQDALGAKDILLHAVAHSISVLGQEQEAAEGEGGVDEADLCSSGSDEEMAEAERPEVDGTSGPLA